MTVSSINNGLEGILPSNPLPKESIQALYATAYDLYNNGKYEESKSFFHFLTLSDVKDSRFWMGLGACFQMLKSYEPAIKAYSYAAIQDIQNPYAHLHAAECFYALKDVDKALMAIDSALIIAKDSTSHKTLIPSLEHLNSSFIKQKSAL